MIEPKLEFIALWPGLENDSPILPASAIDRSWTDHAASEYKRLDSSIKKSPDKPRLPHILRCPGIAHLINTGYIITCHQDLHIKTDGLDEDVDWFAEIDHKDMPNFNIIGDMLNPHNLHTSRYFTEHSPAPGISIVLKITTPWSVVIPDDYYVYMGPVPYQQEKRFTAHVGLMDNEFGPMGINVQFNWHVTNGTECIKKGTPLAHFFLVPKQESKVSQRQAEPREIDEIVYQRQRIQDSRLKFKKYTDLDSV